MLFSAIKEAWNFVDRPLKKLFSVLLVVRLVTNFFDLVGTTVLLMVNIKAIVKTFRFVELFSILGT